MTEKSPIITLPWVGILLLCLTLFWVGLGAYPLIDPDEGRNAEVAREMVAEGHWLPPTLNGQVRYQKPPLYYWAVASSFSLWGRTEFAARLPSALAALLGVLVTVMLGRRLWGEEQGFWAGLFLATFVIYTAYAHIVIFDMLLTLFITCAISLFWLGLTQGKKNLLRLSSLFAALAFLTKGPIGALIPAMALVPPTIYHARKEGRLSIPWFTMLIIFLAVSAPLYILAELKYPGYCYKFFWEENVLRYLTPRYHREGPIFYYLAVILIGLLPWTWLLRRLPGTLRELRLTHPRELLFLGSWILLPTLFFTLSKSKLPHYILPTFPAWALLLASTVDAEEANGPLNRITGLILVIYLVGFLTIGPLMGRYRSAGYLMERTHLNSQYPLVAYKAPWYSLAFYSGRHVEVVKSKQGLQELLKKAPSLYVFAKKNRAFQVQSCSRSQDREVRILGETPSYLLLEVKAKEKERPPLTPPQ